LSELLPELPPEEIVTSSSAQYNLRILLSLRRIIRSVDLHSKKLNSSHNITTPQLVCLHSVSECEPATASRISREVHLSPSTVIGVLDRLESKKLIQRERSTVDRRVVHIWLTELGRKKIGETPSPLQDRLAESLSTIAEAEQAAIAEALDRVVVFMEAQNLEAAPILETGSLKVSPDSEFTEPKTK